MDKQTRHTYQNREAKNTLITISQSEFIMWSETEILDTAQFKWQSKILNIIGTGFSLERPSLI